VNTPEFAKAQRQRKKVEALFAELKNQIGLRRLRLRRMKFVREQFLLAAAAQNIKRLVRFLNQSTVPLTVTPRIERRNSAASTPAPHKDRSNRRVFQHPRLFASIEKRSDKQPRNRRDKSARPQDADK
jgi:Transposase DDE domain